MADQYYVVDREPKRWIESAKKGEGVVTVDSWRHGYFAVGDVRVTGRAAWNANDPIWANSVVYYNTEVVSLQSLLSTVVVHHTANSDTIKGDETKQCSNGRYAAIGYHFLIADSGEVFERRPLEVMGSHAGEGLSQGPLNDPDWGAIGVALQGDYHHADDWFVHSKAPGAQLSSLKRLVHALTRTYGVHKLLMHREVKRAGPPTVCPGDHLVPKIKALRLELKLAA
jgi:N-acetyl-anhydromuramyl-L-alanine amidase AmpD